MSETIPQLEQGTVAEHMLAAAMLLRLVEFACAPIEMAMLDEEQEAGRA